MMQEQCALVVSTSGDRRFEKLRGVRWRINLGILPSSPSSSIDELRRVTADSRRRYAVLRRRLLVDPHLPKDRPNSPDLTIDNPLSQNPDSTWGRFFRNAELEKTLDQDLSRLYPEHGSYFQSNGCQGMLRRILLLWCLRHPEFGYRQGMHELLAPLLYVLHVDVEYLSEVRKTYEDHFTDLFDKLAIQERESAYNFDFKRFLDSMEDEPDPLGRAKKPKSLDELDHETQTVVHLSDAYGAEGELGIVLSEKFMEHDAYSMFDALMNGSARRRSVSMGDFFTYSPQSDSVSGMPPVIEASTALYQLLCLVDESLHSHLVELGVEPQYFALRWLRVLFGREFSLDDLLIVWDEIFSAKNSEEDDHHHRYDGFRILNSPRGALIVGMAVSMMLYIRSSLLATENATSSLQRLLNFPDDIDLRKIIEKAKSLQAFTLEGNTPIDFLPKGSHNPRKSGYIRGHSLSVDSISLCSPVKTTRESYWEEKWRVMNNAEEEEEREIESRRQKTVKKSWSERVKVRLCRADSDPSSTTKIEKNNLIVNQSLLSDLAQRHREEKPSAEAEADSHSSNENIESVTSDTSSLDRGGDYDDNISDKSSIGSVLSRCEDRQGMMVLREAKLKLPRFWKFGRNNSLDRRESEKGKSGRNNSLDRRGESEKGKSGSGLCSTTEKGENLRNMGQSMLQHIKVIESIIQHLDKGSPENMSGNGQLTTANEALKELRRFSDMLSEM